MTGYRAVTGAIPFFEAMKFTLHRRLPALFGLCLCCSLSLPTLSRAQDGVRLSFGRVMPDEVVEEQLGFANPTTGVLEVADVRVTPPLEVRDLTEIILPGQNGAFTLALGANRPLGAFEGTVRILFKDNAMAPLNFAIEGFVIPPIEFDPYPVFFVGTRAGEPASSSIDIINHREQPLNLIAAEEDSDRFETRLETVEAGQRYRLHLLLDGNAASGTMSETILLRAEPPLEQPLTVRANTRIRDRVYHFPDSVDMGAIPLSVARDEKAVETLSQLLMAYRPDTGDFEVTATIDLDYIRLDSERGPKGDRYQVTLTLLPGKVTPGPIQGTLSVRTNDPEFPLLQVPVTGHILD